jgi:hypothetical protein
MNPSTSVLCLSLFVPVLIACGQIGKPITQPAVACVAGTWSVVEADPEFLLRDETTHFAFRWKDGTTVKPTDLEAAKVKLEEIWQVFVVQNGFPEPFCDTAEKHKVNVSLDPSFGFSGGGGGDRNMLMDIPSGAVNDFWGLAHEFTHALQYSTRGLRDSPYTGWFWESHANWMAHQMPEFHHTDAHCSEALVYTPHIYYGSTRNRYCNWQFLEYLKNRFGYAAVNDIWGQALKSPQANWRDEDPMQVLARNQGWSTSQLNDAFGDWAMHNVNWDYRDPDGYDQGTFYRKLYGSNNAQDGNSMLRLTELDPMDLAQRRFSVPSMWAPQRWGYNLVRLMPNAGANKITVSFRGVVQTTAATSSLPGLNNEPSSIPAPDSDWRWGLVAIEANGIGSRYSALMRGSDGELTFDLKADDKEVYMVVVGTPKVAQKIGWDQPYYSLYRFPWMAQFSGAMPQGFEANAPERIPGGRKHPNGGGWVSATATVDASAYVGPYARVLGGTVGGNARIEDHAVVYGTATVKDQAVVGGLSLVGNSLTVSGQAVYQTIIGFPVQPNAVITGTAQLRGDVEMWEGPTLDKGVYSGIVYKGSATDPKQGANLTSAVPEVTATPNYTWR